MNGYCVLCGKPCSGQSECDACSDVVDCPDCEGTGTSNDDWGIMDCENCNGTGNVPYRGR